jgi:hypothetical protein
MNLTNSVRFEILLVYFGILVDETFVSEEEYSRDSEMEYERKEYDRMKHRMSKDKMKLQVTE